MPRGPTDAEMPETAWTDELWEDLEMYFRVRVANSAVLDFEVYEMGGHMFVEGNKVLLYPLAEGKPDTDLGNLTTLIEDAQPLVAGSIKFDGCAHLNFGENGYWHTCDKQQVVRLGAAMVRLYEHAESHFGPCP